MAPSIVRCGKKSGALSTSEIDSSNALTNGSDAKADSSPGIVGLCFPFFRIFKVPLDRNNRAKRCSLNLKGHICL